ncbi:TonB-dependent receptor [Cyclobacterium roseum]|uniref:TonB-dependent receptor n=1 Tax=Cyclobacterium roseum TaxID=2666137 RepID=UPI0013907E44|nr:TonB-dependent receptor [Cyclobacterium roseum]
MFTYEQKSFWVYLFVFFTCLLVVNSVSGQQNGTVSGQVVDKASGEPLPGATVNWEGQADKGTITDENGNFTLGKEATSGTLVIRFLGYQPIARDLKEKSKMEGLVFYLSPEEWTLEEVVVSERKPDQNVASTEMGKNVISGQELKRIPALFGEVDLLRGIQLLPGVTTAGEGSTGLFVRGGSADQNLIQIDGAPIYNPSHFFGFFSVFNPDALSDVALYKGTIPAEFGGRVSSLVDISLKEGNTSKIQGEGGIGSISSRLTVDGPLFSDNSSFIVSGRRTYADLFLTFSGNEDIRDNQLYFYDLSGKFMWRKGPQNKFTLSSYYGSDFLGLRGQFGLGWKNWVNSFTWDRQINDRNYLDVSAYYSRYEYLISFSDEENGFDWSNHFAESGVKAAWTYIPEENSELKAGMHGQLYHFAPVDLQGSPDSGIEPLDSHPRTGLQFNLFLAGKTEVSDRLSLEAGLRWGNYQQIGNGINYLYDNDDPQENEQVIDTLEYRLGQRMQAYQGWEPRFSARYRIASGTSLKAGFNRNYQYIQVASNSSAGLPIDCWVPAGRYILPIRGDQVSAGLFQNLMDNQWEVSLEGYYRDFRNIVDLKQGANVLFTDNIETEILTGNGWSYGMEFLLRKNVGKTSGWLSYTWSRVFRKIEGINRGLPYPPRFDRPHDLSLVVSHQLNDRLSFSGTFIYTTGIAVTFPVGSYEVDDQRVPLYSEQRNRDRFPDYHRLDLSVTLKNKDKGKWWQGSWNFSVYNAYGRKNPFSYEFTTIYNNDIGFQPGLGEEAASARPGVVMTYLFSVLPSITYNFKF